MPIGGHLEEILERARATEDHGAASTLALYWVFAYQGYTVAINGIAAPFIALNFQLDDAGIAALYALIGTSAIGIMAVARTADRLGRRRLVLACLAATPLLALAAAAANSLAIFATVEIMLHTVIGGSIASAIVLITELQNDRSRARGQAKAGAVAGLGAGLCLILVPWLDARGMSWRWLLVLSGAGIVTLPFVWRSLPESDRWRRAVSHGGTRTAHAVELLRGAYAKRTIALVACAFVGVEALASADGWTYYHAVANVGLAPAAASAIVVIGGGLGLLGFPLGAWSCDRFGRVRTVVASWTIAGMAALLYFWGPPISFAAMTVTWLGVSFFGFVAFSSAALVGFRAASSELFPTSLRGTAGGLVAAAASAGAVIGQVAIAALAGTVGNLSVVVGGLALLALPAAAVFGIFVDETRGLTLDVAARECDR